jgi:hypothetical protein
VRQLYFMTAIESSGKKFGNCSKNKMWSDLKNIIIYSDKIMFSGSITYYSFLITQMRVAVTVQMFYYSSHSEQTIPTAAVLYDGLPSRRAGKFGNGSKK